MYKFTPSLLNGWYWYINRQGGDQEQQKQEFLNMLNKVRMEPTTAMIKGVDLEDSVWNVCNGCERAYSDVVHEIADRVKSNAYWQEKVEGYLDDILVYGVADCILQNEIIDIKYTSNYDIGKYQYSVQHKIYMYCTGIKNFTYLITDGKNVYEEYYSYTNDTPDEIYQTAKQFLEWLEVDKEFKQAFDKNWRV